MKYLIRKFIETDKPKIINLVKETLEEDNMQIDLKFIDADLNNINNVYYSNKGLFLVAEDQGGVIGSIGIKEINHDLSQICTFYVRRGFRNNGLGSELLNQAIHFSEKYNHMAIGLEVSNKHQAAIKLYEKNGFKLAKVPASCPRCEYMYIKKM